MNFFSDNALYYVQCMCSRRLTTETCCSIIERPIRKREEKTKNNKKIRCGCPSNAVVVMGSVRAHSKGTARSDRTKT